MSPSSIDHPPSRGVAVCTIVSKNYLAYARVLARSVAAQHPEVPCFVLLVDEVDGYFDPADEPFTLVRLADLGVPNLTGFCFQYTVLELNTALKPSFLAHLFARHGCERLFYLDPDILLLGSLDGLVARFDAASVVLTPHLTAPLPDDGRIPSELNILQAGTYNLGFIGLRDGDTARSLLRWWEARLSDGCQMAVERGMHVDQKWIDFVPGFYDDVAIVRDPGCNAAYWNAPHRPITRVDDRWLIDGVPCTFFHFSGFDAEKPELVSKHQTRITMAELGEGGALFAVYRERLLAAGFATTRAWPYRFATFDNGVRIPSAARRLYLQLGDRARRFGDPFAAGSATSFYAWLNAPVDARTDLVVTHLWRAIHAGTPAVQVAFPDYLGAHRAAFVDWVMQHGAREYGIDPALVPTVETEEPPTSRMRLYRRVVEPTLPVLRPLVRGTIGRNPTMWRRIVHTRMRLTDDARLRSRPTPARLVHPPERGVNVAGYAQSEKGVGEAMRSELRTLEAAGIPYVVNNFVDHDSHNRDSSVALANRNPYPVNLIHVNADQVEHFAATNGVAYFQGRYNIGHWVWELSRFPDAWQRSFDYFDEVWVPTQFTHDAVARNAPLPVVRMPYSLSPGPATTLTRDYFGWPPDRYVFLFVFDFSSYADRKNPLGLLRAFRDAFAPGDGVQLVLKCLHSERAPEAWRQVSELAAVPHVTLMAGVLSREEVDALVQLADGYVSLHRSEGFGLTIAEAMSHGTPVIATGYSGNMDFMTVANSLIVRHRLIELERDQGPYRRGMVWADPDLAHAGELMRWAAAHPDQARALGAQARTDVCRDYCPEAVGALVRARLELVTTRR